MHRFASFNHEILPATDIKINAVSPASLYGRGVFTTIAIYNSKPFLWEKHWRRLNANAQKVGVDISSYSGKEVSQAISSLIKQNNIKNGRCRITFFDESSSQVWHISDENKISLLIQTSVLKEVSRNISLMVSPFLINSTSPIAGVKSCNYVENILALEDTKSKGFDEAIRLNEKGEITSACMANIFWVEYDSKKLKTPSLETGCLAGTTRELIIDSFEVEEVKMNVNFFLGTAEAVFIVSSGIGIKEVTNIHHEKMKFRDHEILNLIKKEIFSNTN